LRAFQRAKIAKVLPRVQPEKMGRFWGGLSRKNVKEMSRVELEKIARF